MGTIRYAYTLTSIAKLILSTFYVEEEILYAPCDYCYYLFVVAIFLPEMAHTHTHRRIYMYRQTKLKFNQDKVVN